MTRSEFLGLLRSVAVAGLVLASGVATAQAPPAPAKKLNILLVGASGMVGSRVLTEATSRGHTVIAAARRPERIEKGPLVKPVKLDASDAAALTALAKDADVIVMSTSPRSSGDPFKEAKALGDAGIAAAKATGKRLFIVGGAGSLKKPDGTRLLDGMPERFRTGEPGAMYAVLQTLKSSDITWTFFSPAMTIRPGEKTGKYRLGTDTLLSDASGESKISAEDFAHALVSELENQKYLKSQMTIAY